MKNKEFNKTHFKSGIKFICDYGYTPQRSIEELIANGASDEEANAIIRYIVQEIEEEIKCRRKKEKVMDCIYIALTIVIVSFFFHAYPNGTKYLLILTVSLGIYKLIKNLVK